MFKTGIVDFWGAVKKYRLIFMLGYREIHQRYQRSMLGPFWITISMGVMIGSIGIIFGSVFKSEMADFLPFLAAGLVIWTFITSAISDSCVAFIVDTRLITQVSLPQSFYVLKAIYRNFLIFIHNFMIIPILMFGFLKPPSFVQLLFVPGLILLIVNLTWVSIIVSIICTRYRDMQQIVLSIMQVLFYVSPIIWAPSLLQETGRAVLLKYNPIYYFLDITRSPLIGEMPLGISWIVSVVIAVVGTCLALCILGKYRSKISYWI